MKTLNLTYSICIAVICGMSADLTAQTNQPGTVVAVLDVAKVFKNHARFKQKMDDMKREVERYEEDVNRQRRELIERAKQLNDTYKPGSPEYKRTEVELAKKESDLRVQAQLKRKEVIDNESRLYYDTYQEIVEIFPFFHQHPINFGSTICYHFYKYST